jgi:hypothetical protein
MARRKRNVKKQNVNKNNVAVTPVSGNLLVAGTVVIVVALMYFLFTGVSPIVDTSSQGVTGSLETEADIGEAVTDMGQEIRDLSGMLKNLDDKIA